MTGICLTVTPKRAWLTTDSAICAATTDDANRMQKQCRATTDPAAAMAQFADPPVEPRHADRFGRKLGVSHDKRLLIAMAGLSGPLMRAAELAASPVVRGLDDFYSRATAALQSFSRARPLEAHGILFATGWSEASGSCKAFYLASDEGWSPQEIAQTHVFLPQPHPAADAYPAFYRHYMAQAGHNVDGLHLSAARMQAEAAARGLYSGRPAIGGEILMGVVDRDGARERVLGVLP